MMRRAACWVLGGIGALAFACGEGAPDVSTSGQGAAGSSGATGGGGAGGAGGQAAVGGAAGQAGTSASGAGASGGGGLSSGSAGTAGSAGGCAAPCTVGAIETTPPGCAEAVCENGACVVRARDKDGDLQRSSACSAKDGTPIQLGPDCDDGNAAIYPSAWDGPAWGSRPDRCNDGIDQNCSGSDGDDVSPEGKSCACVPGDVSACKEDSSGKPLPFPPGPLTGACRAGSKTCVVDLLSGGGEWGPCTGGVPPAPESCNGVDDDCNGKTDDSDAATELWVYDRDGDGFYDPAVTPKKSCAEPKQIPAECTAAYVAATCPGETAAQCCRQDGWRKQSLASGVDCDEKDKTIPGKPCVGTAGVGACAGAGKVRCLDGKPVCDAVARAPALEGANPCNGLDDNCDGETDEGPWGGQPRVAKATCFEAIEVLGDPPAQKTTFIAKRAMSACPGNPGDRDFGTEIVDMGDSLDFAVSTADPRRVTATYRAVIKERGGDGTRGCVTGALSTAAASRAIVRILTERIGGDFDLGVPSFPLLRRVTFAQEGGKPGTNQSAPLNFRAVVQVGAATAAEPSDSIPATLFASAQAGSDLCAESGSDCPGAVADFGTVSTFVAANGTLTPISPRIWVEVEPTGGP